VPNFGSSAQAETDRQLVFCDSSCWTADEGRCLVAGRVLPERPGANPTLNLTDHIATFPTRRSATRQSAHVRVTDPYPALVVSRLYLAWLLRSAASPSDADAGVRGNFFAMTLNRRLISFQRRLHVCRDWQAMP